MSHLRPTLVSEANPDFAQKASRAEKRAVELSARSPKTLEAAQARVVGLDAPAAARFKIEVTFGPQRTVSGPNTCGIQLWESGKKLHGGGDALMYWCKDVAPDSDAGCWSPIPSDAVENDLAVCPGCQRAARLEELTNMRILKLPTRTIASELAKIWHRLGGSADFYCKYHPTDIRYQALLREKGMQAARRLKGLHIYTLARIVRDLSSGASLEGRVFAFLTA